MRVLLDSNVLISGIVFRGNKHRLLQSTFQRPHTFLVSEEIQREITEVLTEKFPRLRKEAEEVLSLIRVEVIAREAYKREMHRVPALRDPADAHVLAAAFAARCDLVVTGDRDLLDLERVGGLKVVSPSEALSILRV